MKLTPIIAAALLAGSCTLAMAQGGGSGGGAGSDLNPHRVGRGTDANPSASGNPAAGNSAASPVRRGLSRNDNARWNGRHHSGRYYSADGSAGWQPGRYGGNWNGGQYGWNGGYGGGWQNAPVGLRFGHRPAFAGPNECYEDLGYGRFESCDW